MFSVVCDVCSSFDCFAVPVCVVWHLSADRGWSLHRQPMRAL